MAKKIIKAQMKQRLDTKANWAAQNPVLLAGELGIVSDDPNLYKVGDGTTAWNALPFRGFDGTITQETGSSENTVMSQKAVTDKLTELSEEKQDVLVSGVNIKTINGQSILGRGNVYIYGGGGEGGGVDPELLEGFIPLRREFSDEFNNDFAR